MNGKIKSLEDYASKNNIPIIQAEGLEFIISKIKKHNIKNILEIGSAIGYSAIMMALIREDIKVTTVERDKDRYNEAIKNIKNFDLEDRITIYNVDAFDYNDNNKYDLIFIDAAKGQYIKFFEKFKFNLNDKGMIVTDNLKFHGMVGHTDKIKNRNTKQLVKKIEKYIEFLQNNEEYKTEFYDIGDGISISKKYSNDK